MHSHPAHPSDSPVGKKNPGEVPSGIAGSRGSNDVMGILLSLFFSLSLPLSFCFFSNGLILKLVFFFASFLTAAKTIRKDSHCSGLGSLPVSQSLLPGGNGARIVPGLPDHPEIKGRVIPT